MPSSVRPLPGYLHEHGFRTTNVVELKVACADHGTWHTWPLKALYRAGTRIARSHSHHRGALLPIEIQAEPFDPAWESAWKNQLTAAYARAVSRSVEKSTGLIGSRP
jgi:hypothetical protein